MANRIFPGHSNSSATLVEDSDESSLVEEETKQSHIPTDAIPGATSDPGHSPHEQKTRGGVRGYMRVVRPGELLVADDELPGVEVVYANQTSHGLAGLTTNGRLPPTADSALPSRLGSDQRKGIMPDGPVPRANAGKYQSEVIGGQ